VRYAQGGGLTDAGRVSRERIRLQAVGRFEDGQKNKEIAAALRVSERSVERWRRAWRERGETGVLSKGSPGRPRLGPAQMERLERELERGPLAHGWADQRWTLARIKTLIGRLFHVSYTVEGTWLLLKRNGWSWQQPARRAIERDEDAVELWKKEVWPQVKQPRRVRGLGRLRGRGRAVDDAAASENLEPDRADPRWCGSVDAAPAGSRWQA
jgi:transposase